MRGLMSRFSFKQSKNFVFPTSCVLTSQNTDVRKLSNKRHADGVLETVEKLSFFRQSVFWLRKTRTSESSHTETFSLLKYENRGTRPRFSCVCAANAFECALPRDCCFGVKTDFIDRLRTQTYCLCPFLSKIRRYFWLFYEKCRIALPSAEGVCYNVYR